MNNPIGIIQGRLSETSGDYTQLFPSDPVSEFIAAKSVGLTCMEWLWDEPGFGLLDSPIPVGHPYGITHPSLLADRFKVLDCECNADVAFDFCHRARIPRIVLPCSYHHFFNIAYAINRIPDDIDILLETPLAPRLFKMLLNDFPRAGVCYDVGNSAGLGYDMREDRIRSVHIKDKKRGGPSVPLGTGDVRWDDFADCLASIHYDGPLILEAARPKAGTELADAERNIAFVRDRILRPMSAHIDAAGNYQRPSD